MQEKVDQTHIAIEYRRVETSASSGVSREMDHRHIAAAIGQWRRRLNACDTCVRAQGRYFEQHLR